MYIRTSSFPFFVILLWLVKFIAGKDFVRQVEYSAKILDDSGLKDASIEDHPYQVSLLYNNKQFCGGSIISENEVLTAAHCVHNETLKNLIVRVGSSIKFKGKAFTIKDIAIHKNYIYRKNDYDIAILILDKRLKFGERIQPIKLAETRSPDGSRVNVTGWGSTSERFPIYPDKLKVVTVLIINQNTCRNWHKNTKYQITDRMVCAGYAVGGKDACAGDSGGPLVDVLTGKQVGIVSFGIGCGRPKRPTVYTSIPDILDFNDIYKGFEFQGPNKH